MLREYERARKLETDTFSCFLVAELVRQYLDWKRWGHYPGRNPARGAQNPHILAVFERLAASET